PAPSPGAPPPPGPAPTPPARRPAGARGRPRNALSERVSWVSRSSTPPPILPHVGGRDRWGRFRSALHSSTPHPLTSYEHHGGPSTRRVALPHRPPRLGVGLRRGLARPPL